MKKFLVGFITAAAFCGAPALAADMAVKAPPLPPPVPVYSWTGFYIGGSAGYNWSPGDVDPSETVTFLSGGFGVDAANTAAAQNAAIPSALSTRRDGFIGGGQFGYNRQVWGQYVLGVEADFSGLAAGGSNNFNTAVPIALAPPGVTIASTTSVDRKLDSLGTVRGRVGFLPVDRLLIFATGGFAFGRAESSTTITQSCTGACAIVFPNPATGSASRTLAGWALGGGMEYAFMTSWSVKAEYLHYDLGNMGYGTTPLASTVGVAPFTTLNVASTANFKGDIARVGVNYKFGP